jgi:hypothetical protein
VPWCYAAISNVSRGVDVHMGTPGNVGGIDNTMRRGEDDYTGDVTQTGDSRSSPGPHWMDGRKHFYGVLLCHWLLFVSGSWDWGK